MDALAIINKYYPEDNELKHILLTHSRSVADKALWIAGKHPELNLDKQFLEEAAMLHDIGIFMTDAEGICCFGSYPYICHGYLGADLMRKEGFPRHALVCERHTGAGMSLQSIIDQQLPGSSSEYGSGFAGRTGYLLCRQVFLKDASGQGKERGEGVKEYFTLWGRWDNPF